MSELMQGKPDRDGKMNVQEMDRRWLVEPSNMGDKRIDGTQGNIGSVDGEQDVHGAIVPVRSVATPMGDEHVSPPQPPNPETYH